MDSSSPAFRLIHFKHTHIQYSLLECERRRHHVFLSAALRWTLLDWWYGQCCVLDSPSRLIRASVDSTVNALRFRTVVAIVIVTVFAVGRARFPAVIWIYPPLLLQLQLQLQETATENLWPARAVRQLLTDSGSASREKEREDFFYLVAFAAAASSSSAPIIHKLTPGACYI